MDAAFDVLIWRWWCVSVAQKLARHSDVKSIANIYTHIGVNDQVAAISWLSASPTFSPSKPSEGDSSGDDMENTATPRKLA